MSDKVSFQNHGLIDERCISTIGVSVKETENPIGFFGTGLKYAIAIILRAGGSITVWRGTDPLRFDTVDVEVRGRMVSLVRMNDRELGFTTDLGKHWQMWQAFREIYCNTMDEGGNCEPGEMTPVEGCTTIVVNLHEFACCLSNIGQFILQTEPVFESRSAHLHPGPSTSVFYRSIRVSNGIVPKPFLYIPNLQEGITLTEDRTAKDQWQIFQTIAQAILTSTNKQFLEQWLTAGFDYAEYNLDLDWPSIQPSEEFLSVAHSIMRDAGRPLNLTARKVLRRYEKAPDPVVADLFATEQNVMTDAIEMCHGLKYCVDEFPIIVVESLGKSILGLADRDTRRIYIAREAIQMGVSTCASTLIEEWAHIKHGFDDCSREFQNWLFNQITRVGEAYIYECNRSKE